MAVIPPVQAAWALATKPRYETPNNTSMNMLTRSTMALTMALAGFAPMTTQAADTPAHKEHAAGHNALQACAAACESCVTGCLNEEDVKAMVPCIKLCRDCADICALTAQFMARDSAHAGKAAALCASICDACGEECAKHKMAHCQACAEACKKCAEECRKMAK